MTTTFVGGLRLSGMTAPLVIDGPMTGAWFKARGARLLFLPPYSPNFNPIENAFAKLKALLRKAAARTVDDLSRAIGAAIETFTPAERANYFTAAEYDAY